jgi:hypothetical protein
MTRIVCLANSWKRQERCIAGIELATGRWVRPVTASPDGGVPRHVRALRHGEPCLLDVLDIPLAGTGPDYGFESENRLILSGRWYFVRRLRPQDMRRYVAPAPEILHTDNRYVTVPWLQALPPTERRTLQLVETAQFSVQATKRQHSGDTLWKGTFTALAGKRLTANITDPVFSSRLDAGHQPANHCLLTISLSLPWRPPDWTGDDPCWKLIAGVIELDAGSQITQEEIDAVPF